MTIEELAARLDGREVGDEITPDEAEEAKESGVLVLYGASDDLLEAEGAFRDEVGAYGGTAVQLDAKGFIPKNRPDRCFDEEMELYFLRKRSPEAIQVCAEWCPEDVQGNPSWVISTTAPHATFRIMEDGELYCVGIVLALPGGTSANTGDAGRERASEIEYLRWFRVNIDLGPAGGDIQDAMAESFMKETGKNLPGGWNFYQDGETSTDTFPGGAA